MASRSAPVSCSPTRGRARSSSTSASHTDKWSSNCRTQWHCSPDHPAHSVALVNLRSATLCVFTCTILGGSFTVSRSILNYPMLTGQAVRYALAAVALAIIVAFSRSRVRPTGREFLLLTAVSVVGLVAFNALLLFALRHADPALV